MKLIVSEYENMLFFNIPDFMQIVHHSLSSHLNTICVLVKAENIKSPQTQATFSCNDY